LTILSDIRQRCAPANHPAQNFIGPVGAIVAGICYQLIGAASYLLAAILLGFGAASAIGGLVGAALQGVVQSSALAIVFALLLIFAGVGSLTGFAQRMRFSGRRSALVGGALSGLLGGLVGNQGGIRAAALLGFDVEREAFVGTATAVALIVDGARIPVYLATQGAEIAARWPLIVLLSIGTILGTVFGGRVLRRMNEAVFRRVVGVLLLVLGAYTLVRALS